jgi:Tetratricopeptide repeat
MKLLVLAVIGVIGCGSARPAPPRTGAAAKHADMLAMMEGYLASPFGDGADPDRADQITRFAVESHDIQVILDETVVPFMAEDLDPEVQKLLLTAFVAGDGASQLRAGKKRDDVAAGIAGELKVYRALQGAAATRFPGRKVRSPRLDALLALEAKGQLRVYFDRVAAGRKGAEMVTLSTPEAAAAARDEAESRMEKLTNEGVKLLKAGKPAEAIDTCFDKVIAYYEQEYPAGQKRIYSTHYPAEVLAYMMESANKGEDAVALSPYWADAWFLKSYALTELHQGAEARTALERAIALAPHFAQYLSELGYLHQVAKDWRRSLEIYKQAEDAVGLISVPAIKLREQLRAMRGQGHALIELGDRDAAEQKFLKVLELDPDDDAAKQALEYIKEQKAQKPQKPQKPTGK